MQVLLRIANGKTNVRKVRLQSDTIIGRSPECQLKVASNQISRRHCQILLREAFVAIKDLGSANGTFVNGRRIPPEVEVPLTPGTRIMLGPLHFTVDYEPVAQPAALVPAVQDAAVDTVSNASDKSVGAGKPSNRSHRVELKSPEPAKPAEGKPDTALANTASSSLSDTAYMNPPDQQTKGEKAGAEPAQASLSDNSTLKPPPVAPVIAVPAGAPQFTAASPAEKQASARPASPPTESSEHDFHFGIFAASGSGVVVESAPEIPMVRGPVPTPIPAKTDKPGKRGFFELLGWGKKDPAKAGIVGELGSEKQDHADERDALDADDEIELVAGTDASDHSVDILLDDEPVLDPDAGGSGQDLNRFFNSHK